MIIWDDAITILQKLSADTDATNLTFLKLMANTGFKEVLAELGRPVLEKTKTTTTVANQRGYQLPPDYNWLKSVKITVGSTTYTPVEEESQEQWDLLTQTTQTGTIPQYYFVRPRFGFQGSEVQFEPVPSTAGYTITLVYEAIDRDLSVAKYTTGTVAVTNGSATVTGTGTTFTAAMVNRYFQITDADGDGLWYKVATFSSSTSITLENFYQGTTDSSANYQIAEAFHLPEDLHMLPIYYALQHYFSFRRNPEKVAEFKGLYDTGMAAAKRRYGTRTRSNIIRSKANPANSSYPRWFPSNIV